MFHMFQTPGVANKLRAHFFRSGGMFGTIGKFATSSGSAGRRRGICPAWYFLRARSNDASSLIDRAARGGKVRLEAHCVGDPQELLVGFQNLEKIAKRLESPHRNLPDGSALI
jgi:hypothetical protein